MSPVSTLLNRNSCYVYALSGSIRYSVNSYRYEKVVTG